MSLNHIIQTSRFHLNSSGVSHLDVTVYQILSLHRNILLIMADQITLTLSEKRIMKRWLLTN